MPKKSKVSNFLKKHAAKRKSAPPAPAFKAKARRNPNTTALAELGSTVGVGVGAYVANRIVTGVAKKALETRIPYVGSHIGPITSIAITALIWYLAERWDWLRRYSNSALVGSTVALFQALLTRYLPGVEVLLDAAGRPPGLGEYLEEDEESNSLPGTSILDNKLISAITSEDEDSDLMTGVFARK